MTVIMALLLRIFTSLLRHYYALIRLLLPVIMDRYYLYNGSIIADYYYYFTRSIMGNNGFYYYP